jgi:DNA helicase-2/ATP-dependent DNA helicase PcrA
VAQEIAETQLRNHYKNQDYAILYRTNAQSRIFEEALRKRNIPYKIYGGLSFYQRKEIKDLLAYFRLVVNPWDNEALKRIINYPARGIGQVTLSKLETAAVNAETSIWKIIGSLPGENFANLNKGTVAKVLNFKELILEFSRIATEFDAWEASRTIAKKTGILKELYNDKSPEGLSRHENIQELLNGIQEFSLNALEEGRPAKLESYLEDVALLTDQDNEKDEDRDKVTLMTVHSAKGLEFKNVFVVGLEKNLFPSAHAEENGSPEAIEEERRLFYVALTRAMENAWFSYANQRYRWGSLEFCSPSRFLKEIDEKYLEPAESLTFGASGRQNEGQDAIYNRFQTRPQFKTDRQLYSPGKRLGRESESVGKTARKAESSADSVPFEGDDAEKIVQGMKVEHQRFGVGKVLKVEGVAPNKKAIVFFHNSGQKQLLLRFARLKIID